MIQYNTTNHLKIKLEPTLETPCIVNIPHIMSNIQCNCGVINQLQTCGESLYFLSRLTTCCNTLVS